MMILNNESVNQAVVNVYIHDIVVYNPTRLLPFRLRKDYQKAPCIEATQNFIKSETENQRKKQMQI